MRGTVNPSFIIVMRMTRRNKVAKGSQFPIPPSPSPTLSSGSQVGSPNKINMEFVSKGKLFYAYKQILTAHVMDSKKERKQA